MFGTLFTMPDASTVIASTSAYSGTYFTELLDVIWLPLAITVAVFAVAFIWRHIGKGIRSLLGRKGGRGRRRRR